MSPISVSDASSSEGLPLDALGRSHQRATLASATGVINMELARR
jgi:hypothetical protein